MNILQNTTKPGENISLECLQCPCDLELNELEHILSNQLPKWRSAGAGKGVTILNPLVQDPCCKQICSAGYAVSHILKYDLAGTHLVLTFWLGTLQNEFPNKTVFACHVFRNTVI